MPDFAVKTAFTATDRVSPAFSRMQKSAGMFTSAIKGMLPILGGAAILQFANKSIEAWKVQETAVANVEAGLKSTGNAIGMTSKQFQDMASKAQENGIFGDETILQNATAQLLTFGSVGKDNFERVQNAAMDVTAKLNGLKATGDNLKSITIMMGKAMDDPIRGMGALRKAGLQFDDAQEKMIKNMALSGNKMGAQSEMLRLIEQLYGGTSKELSKTSAGMENASKMKIGDTMELIGKQIMPLKQTLFEFVSFILPGINAALPVVTDILKALKIPLIAVASGFVAYKLAIMAMKIPMIVNTGLIWGAQAALWAMQVATMAASVGAWILNGAMYALGVAFAIGLWPILAIIAAIALFAGAAYLIYKNWEPIKEFFSGLWGGIVEGFNAAIDWIIQKFTSVVNWVSNKWGKVKGFFGFANDAGNNAPNSVGMKSPNESGANLQAGNTNVNVYSNGTEAKAEVTPRRGAKVNMSKLGYQQ